MAHGDRSRINHIHFHSENPAIVFAPQCVTKVANTLATVELITVHYACFGGLFGPSPEGLGMI